MIVLLFLIGHIGLNAQNVSVEQAEQMADAFFAMHNEVNSSTQGGAQKIKARTQRKVRHIGNRAMQPAMYAVSENNNWVLISGDERVTPILAYSDSDGGEFPQDEEMPPAMKDLLDWYEYQIEYIRDSVENAPLDSGWVYGLDYPGISLTVPVPPMLDRNNIENAWGQDVYDASTSVDKAYNKFCPVCDSITQQRALAGCVAVAMSQILWFWQWPKAAVVRDETGNFRLREYDWSLMPSLISNSSTIDEANMVATLLHDVGESVYMKYQCNSSSAFAFNINPVLRSVFNYLSDDMISRNSYTNTQWLNKLKTELEYGRPILYGGESIVDGGHRFVIDGYNSQNQFHINLGWSGVGNAFYLLDSIISPSADSFSQNQTAILRLRPNYPSCSPVVVPTSSVWTSNFTQLYGGGVTIENRIVSSNQKGIIYSGDYIRLGTGVHIANGAQVHIAIRDIDCDVPILLAPPRLSSSADSFHSSTISNTNDNISFSVYPNPVVDMLSVSASSPIQQLSIYNVNGQCVLQTIQCDVNVSLLPSGLYLLSVQTENGNRQTKFIKR